MKLIFVDTITTLFFFTLIAAFTELVIVGMEPLQVLTTRLIMVPVMVLTGRPYGVWRDWIFVRISPKHRLSRVVVDVVAFLSFQVPVYAATLAIAGANTSEMVTAVGSGTFFMMILSRPFGLFLEFSRQMNGVAHSQNR